MDEDFNDFLKKEKPQENKQELKAEDIILDFYKSDPNFFYPLNYTEKKVVDINMPSYFVKQQ